MLICYFNDGKMSWTLINLIYCIIFYFIHPQFQQSKEGFGEILPKNKMQIIIIIKVSIIIKIYIQRFSFDCFVLMVFFTSRFRSYHPVLGSYRFTKLLNLIRRLKFPIPLHQQRGLFKLACKLVRFLPIMFFCQISCLPQKKRLKPMVPSFITFYCFYLFQLYSSLLLSHCFNHHLKFILFFELHLILCPQLAQWFPWVYIIFF